MFVAQDNDVFIRPAQDADVPAIFEIAENRSLKKSGESASNTGFLVSDYSLEDYHELLQRAEFFYVACVDSKVAGFVVAYSRERIKADEWLNLQVAENFSEFTVIKQVGVSEAYAGKGVATQLYERILQRAGSDVLIAAVVSDPPNRPSVALHRKMGFQPMTTLTPPDGIPRTVWVRQPAHTQLLERHLTLAVDLYRHEDTLNWQKLNNFFYISTGLIAICGFSLSQDSEPRNDIITSAAAMGFAVSLAFFITLRAGVSYLQARKATAVSIERSLIMRRDSAIFNGRNAHGSKLLQQSPTRIVLQVMPLLGTVGWLVVLLLGLAGAF